MEEAIKLASNQGLWALLFVLLLFYVLRTNEKRESKMAETNEKREAKLEDIIDKFADKFCIVEDMQKDIEKIKDNIGGLR